MGLEDLFSFFQPASKKKNDLQLKYMQSYHYQRGKELRNQGRDGDAFEELKLELDEHPENGLAHMLIADIHYEHNILGTALKASNNAIKLLQETENSDFLSQTYYLRGKIYRALQDKENWYNDIQRSVEYNPDSVDSLGELGDYYYYNGDYNSSDCQFNKIIDLQPHNPYGYMGRGRNDQGRNEHKSAIAHFERASQMDDNYSSAYSFKAESLLALDKKSDAIDAIITALSINDQDQKARDLMIILSHVDKSGLILKIKAKAIQNQDNDYWYRLLGWYCAGYGDMKEAIIAYQNAYKISASPELCDFKAYCWSAIGAYDKAIEEEQIAMEKDAQNESYKERMIMYKAESGQLDDAISELSSLIDLQPDNHRLYFNRGRLLFELGKYEDAINDFDTTISLKDNWAKAFLYKGWALSEIEKEEDAKNCWQRIIEKEEIMEDTQSVLPLALYFLDLDNDAVSKCDSIISQLEAEENRFGIGDTYLYLAAVFCRTRHENQAIQCLRKSVEACNCRLWYMSNGKLLKPLHNDEKFIEFINFVQKQKNDEKQAIEAEVNKLSVNKLNKIKAEIPFVREGKMCKVKCEINGLPLHFIFDTGASDVTMSSVEATFMLKNGYLSESDLSGKQYYRTADGSIAEGVKVCLKNVVFAGLTLSNVKAGIVTNQSAPLLLGQSILERLGRIEIDNDNMLIKINS